MFTTKSGREITYFGREYTADIQRADGKQHLLATVDDLFDLLLKVWCKDTARILHIHPARKIIFRKMILLMGNVR